MGLSANRGCSRLEIRVQIPDVGEHDYGGPLVLYSTSSDEQLDTMYAALTVVEQNTKSQEHVPVFNVVL